MAFNYQEFAKDSEREYKENNDKEQVEPTHNSFVIDAMCNSNLGKISNLHLALCDQLPEGEDDDDDDDNDDDDDVDDGDDDDDDNDDDGDDDDDNDDVYMN
jgi:hypothetical protein